MDGGEHRKKGVVLDFGDAFAYAQELHILFTPFLSSLFCVNHKIISIYW
jgi:hypothetical protein